MAAGCKLFSVLVTFFDGCKEIFATLKRENQEELSRPTRYKN